MNDTRISPDDPKLTAYALGEMSGNERAAMESALRQNPALRIRIEEIRATVARMEAALAGDSICSPSIPSAAKAGLVIELNGHAAGPALPPFVAPRSPPATPRQRPTTDNDDDYPIPDSRPGLLKFPQFYYLVATAAAACFAVVVALRAPPPPAMKRVERTIRHEIVLIPPGARPAELTSTAVPEPAETRVAGVALPAVSEEPGVLPNAGESSPVHTDSPATTAFVDGSLSLLSQARRDLATAWHPPALNQDADKGARGIARGSGERPRRPVAPGQNAFQVGGIGASATSAAAFPSVFDVLTPPIGAPVVAGTTLPALVPNASLSPSYGGLVTPTSAGDIVVLSAFTVTADRAVGFSTPSSVQGVASDKRGRVDRDDDRPHAPPGAKFGRSTDAYSFVRDNDFLPARQNPLSTYPIDVDTASYANVRRVIEVGSPPPRDAVRIEELLNYFPYRYAPPTGDAPFAAALEVAVAPWAPRHRLVRIGLKAREVPAGQRPPASLVFLLDVSGSMNQPNKLPLVKQAVRSLIGKLRADDRVAFVTYAGNSGLALPSTPVANAREIMNALDALTPGGSSGAMGIQLAYDIAGTNFVQNGYNRVILCTDGDFNVGATSEGELVRLVEEKAAAGVSLTVLGLGMGDYRDATLEKLAGKGNGDFGYIDTGREAEKILLKQVGTTAVTVAKDVKIQVEFNPATVSSYRLIGYENRRLRKEDFNSDRVDSAEIDAGHTVTALYEIVPVGAEDSSADDGSEVDELKYAERSPTRSRLEGPRSRPDPLTNELLTVKVRYKKPDSFFSFTKPIEFPLVNASKAFAKASADFRFAAAVAQFGMILRGSPHRGSATMRDVAAWAATAASPADDPDGYRGEFLELVRKAQTMMD